MQSSLHHLHCGFKLLSHFFSLSLSLTLSPSLFLFFCLSLLPLCYSHYFSFFSQIHSPLHPCVSLLFSLPPSLYVTLPSSLYVALSHSPTLYHSLPALLSLSHTHSLFTLSVTPSPFLNISLPLPHSFHISLSFHVADKNAPPQLLSTRAIGERLESGVREYLLHREKKTLPPVSLSSIISTLAFLHFFAKYKKT